MTKAAFTGTYSDLKCRNCKRVKPAGEFYVERRTKRGASLDCKECHNEKCRAYRIAAGESLRERERQRNRLPHRINKPKRNWKIDDMPSQVAWQKRNTEKMLAQRSVHYAVKIGKIIRPDKCEKCLSVVAPHAHHEDYSKPLDIIWLCGRCHGERHRELNERKRKAETTDGISP